MLRSLPRNKGFTLIEALIAVLILAILAGWGVPNMQRLVNSNRVATTTNEMIAGLNLARVEALKNGRGSGVCASSNGTSCTGTWANGFLVWADSDESGTLNGSEKVLRVGGGQTGFSASASASSISFDYKGRRRSKDDTSITLTPDTCTGNMQRTFTVDQIGRVDVQRETCS